MPLRRTVSMVVDATAEPTASNWVPFDIYNSPFNVSVGVVIGSAASGTFRVEHTFHDVLRDPDGAVAHIHEDLDAENVNSDGNYAYPIAAARLVVVSAASAMTVTAIFTQTG